MKISFNVNYRTRWGESLYICGDLKELGGGDQHKAVEMQLSGADSWHVTIDVARVRDFNYHYIVKPEQGAWRLEWGAPHRFRAGKGISHYEILDSWQDMPSDKPYYSSAFTDGMLMRSYRDQQLEALPGMLNIRVEAPMIEPDELLALAGTGEGLGNWDVSQAVRFNDCNYPVWEANIPLADITEGMEYKFLIIKKTGEVVAWENRNNRVFNIATTDKKTQVVLDGLRIANPRNNWKGAGTAIPVFSIRSEEDFGVGDFLDIKKMVNWCEKTGQKVLQLLPINDTTLTGTWLDSYPYKANSTFALHPMFVRLEAAGKLKDAERREYFEALGKELNALPEVDYERVNNAKHEYMRELYAEQGKVTAKKDTYAAFVAANDSWLRPYAAWSVLRDINGTPDNSKWGDMAEYDAARVEAFIAAKSEEVGYYYFLQYHLDKQLREVRDYAHQHGVVLKGDIPIGISRFSVDAWLSPRLFNMNSQAGAPPDDFSVLGQNWGFPTYNWEEMASDGFAWWKARFTKMAEYFDAYRIDHILGFFRIWQIPLDALHGLLGIFNPALPFHPDELRNNYDFWLDVDLQTRPLILEWMLTDFFGEHTAEAKERFLDHIGGGRYHLKEYVNNQKKVADYFATQPKDEKHERMCNALLGLIDDVLFIEDPVQKGHYHPRITAQFTYQYRILNDYEKWCFDRVYNDFYYHRHNDFWYGKAMWKLPPLLDATSMLTCAEDLGMIPDCVPPVMHNLEILSLEIQRMPKDPKVEFANTWTYPYYSVCTTSTHDMPGIRAWWESDPAMAQRFYNHVLDEYGQAPFFAEPWICAKIVELQLYSPSMLCILPLQDWLAMDGTLRRENPNDEVINVPANPTHYWRYRTHISVEELLKQDNFNTTVAAMIAKSSRS